ncbi:MAG TPA: hypothetical protein VFP72_06540 [Kineosporiaceae bacterium]|nr:hypothetical protein [Kineosporiaceae bacterium]
MSATSGLTSTTQSLHHLLRQSFPVPAEHNVKQSGSSPAGPDKPPPTHQAPGIDDGRER